MNSMHFDFTPAAVIFAASIVLSAAGLMASPALIDRCLFRPYWFLRKKQYDTVIMSGFVHADFGHLLFNMMTFYFFAFPLESRIGGVKFALLYLIGLVFSEAETYRKHRNDPNYATLGASGAITAVLFASIVYDPTSSIYLFLLPIPIPAPLFAVGYLAYTYYASRNQQDRINHDAHFSGALIGLVFVAVTDPSMYSRLWEMLS